MAGRQLQTQVPENIIINVRFHSHQRSYELNRRSTVAELRQQVAVDHGLPPKDMKILLGGSLLADDLTIEGSGVGIQSMLFAIQHKSPTTSTVTAAALSQPSVTPAPMTGGVSLATNGQTGVSVSDRGDCARQLLDQYFVFCKLCGEVQPGRLRVKCSVCGDGAVLVDKGPASWEDVLTPGRVSGKCLPLQCEDCVPVFYFKCKEHHTGNVSGTVVALHHIRPNRPSVMCITCEDIINPVVVFPCASSHVMCVHCFTTYCTVRLGERGFVYSQQYGYTLPCPAGCPESFIQEQHHFCIMGPEEYNRYKDFAAEECLLADGGMYCPRKECGCGFLLETADRRVICPHCKYVFCRHCREAAHPGDCQLAEQRSEFFQEFSNPERAEHAQWERQTAHTIQETTKGCPGCGTRTERDGGCMHMVCARCSEQWCWLCVKTWDRECQGLHWFG